MCGAARTALVVPDKTVFSIAEHDRATSFRLLLHLNSEVARSILKLVAWAVRGGYYRHQTSSVEHLPLPLGLPGMWSWALKLLPGYDGEDLNTAARKLESKHRARLVDELRDALGLGREELDRTEQPEEELEEEAEE